LREVAENFNDLSLLVFRLEALTRKLLRHALTKPSQQKSRPKASRFKAAMIND
jgi:hypothetical protein